MFLKIFIFFYEILIRYKNIIENKSIYIFCFIFLISFQNQYIFLKLSVQNKVGNKWVYRSAVH
jgi:hypothetical protein